MAMPEDEAWQYLDVYAELNKPKETGQKHLVKRKT